MRKIFILVSSLLFCIISFAQTTDEIEAMCKDAMISVRSETFDKAVETVRKWNDNPYYWAGFIMLD